MFSILFVLLISIPTLLLSSTSWLPVALAASKSSRGVFSYKDFVGPTNVVPKSIFIKYTFWHLPFPYVSTHLFQMTFIGTIACIFALIGFLNFTKLQEKHSAITYKILVICTALITLGTPFAWFIYKFVPGMQYLTALGRILFLWTFGLSILVALGIETVYKIIKKIVIKNKKIHFKYISTTFSLIILIVSLANVLQTSRYGLFINPPAVERTASNLFPETSAIKFLKQNAKPDDRIIPIFRGDSEWSPPILYASHQMLYNINSAAGYESIVSSEIVDTWRIISGEQTADIETINSSGSYIRYIN